MRYAGMRLMPTIPAVMSLASSSSRNGPSFRAVSLAEARTLTDGMRITGNTLAKKKGDETTDASLDSSVSNGDVPVVILPYVGFGTYKLGKANSEQATLQALRHGYRSIDTAFIYGGETTEAAVGRAIQTFCNTNDNDKKKGDGRADRHHCRRESIFLTTKHWRAYHGYEPTLKCLRLSLKRLQVDYIDLYLMHWPGPAWNTMCRRKDVTDEDPWHYSKYEKSEMTKLRAETWRAMEDSCRKGLVRSIGVSNMTVRHLETLKRTATIWPPSVNQVELHPLYPQTELLEYCKREGIVVQAYASLGGQDTGKAAWRRLFPDAVVDDSKDANSAAENNNMSPKTKKQVKAKKPKLSELPPADLLHSPIVTKLAAEVDATPAQVLLRWGLERSAVVIPKTTNVNRLDENAAVLEQMLSPAQVEALQTDLLEKVVVEQKANEEDGDSVVDEQNHDHYVRLCWRNDPLRLMDFD